MQVISVALKENSYPIYLGESLLSPAADWLSHIPGQHVFIVTNATVAKHYLLICEQSLSNKNCETMLLPDGEQYKTLTTVEKIWDQLITNHHHRDTTIIALGGGVVGDMAGFAAACYQRGVALIQIPTTLLAQVDAAIGGKTAVNHPQAKNMIGAFHQPRCVVIDVTTLKTLPEREYIAGFAEVIKYALIRDADFFLWLEKNMPALLNREIKALEYAVSKSCQHKAEIVAADEKESGLRMLLNLGHTYGHAVEAVTHYQTYLHGEAVAIGLYFAAKLSQRLGYLTDDVVERIKQLLLAATLPIEPEHSIDTSALLAAMKKDKKNTETKLRFILLHDIGQAFISEKVTLQQIAE